MKRICFILGVLFFFANSVLAKEIWVIDDEGLIPYQREENCPIYPIPSEGVPVEIAGQLIRGKITKHIIEGDEEIKWTLKPFWHLQKIEIIPRTEISYSASAWISEEILPLKNEKTKWLGVILFFIAPAICILAVSVINQNAKLGDKKLFVFYGMFFILIIYGALMGFFIGEFLGGLIGLFVGIFAGGSIGGLAGGSEGVITGMFACIFVGTIAGMFGNNIAIIKGYLIFITLACLFSFIAAKAIKKIWPVRI